MVNTTVFKKLALDGLTAFVKAFGSESGKRVGNIDKATGKKSIAIPDIKTSVDLVTKDYDWDVVKHNFYHLSIYAKEMLPIVGATGAAYLVLPVFAGTAVAGIGAGAVETVYTLSNGAVLLGGTYKLADKVYKITREPLEGKSPESPLETGDINPKKDEI